MALKKNMNPRTQSALGKKTRTRKKSKYAHLMDFVEERESVLKDRISWITDEQIKYLNQFYAA